LELELELELGFVLLGCGLRGVVVGDPGAG
jgi:hypothetical protein